MIPFRTARGETLQVSLVATDLDRTLTNEDLVPDAAALAALHELRARGVTTVLATGRRHDELDGGLLAAFDCLVVEGGAMAGDAQQTRPVKSAKDWQARLAAWLDAGGHEFALGKGSLSAPASAQQAIASFPWRQDLTVMPNLDRIDVTAAGIDKGSGLRWVSARNRPPQAGASLAFGDGPNDVPLFAAASYGVAVANAVPELKHVADEVMNESYGAGVAQFLRTRLLGSPLHA